MPHRFLCLLQHVEVPFPTPKKDEVVLKLEAASLNPSDWKIQKGILWPVFPGKLPHIPGNSVLPMVCKDEYSFYSMQKNMSCSVIYVHKMSLSHRQVGWFVVFG